MDFDLYRFSSEGDDSLGILMHSGDEGDRFECFILEDEHRSIKVRGETRIPAGRYEIKLRDAGNMTKRYKQRFPDLHAGMLHLQDVPDFRYVYIHIGNKEDQTDGCLLTGDIAYSNRQGRGAVGKSTGAYLRLYKKILGALRENARVYINIIDFDRRVSL